GEGEEAEEPARAEGFELLLLLPALVVGEGEAEVEPRARVEVALERLGDGARGVLRDGEPRDRRDRRADAGEEEAEVVVELGLRGDGGAGVPRARPLLDGDGRREPRDEVDVRLVHPLEELARVGGERLDVAPLALGVDRVEDEARLPRARRAGDDDELLLRDREVYVLEVVLPGALDDELVPGEAPRGAVAAGLAVRPGLRAGGPLRLRHASWGWNGGGTPGGSRRCVGLGETAVSVRPSEAVLLRFRESEGGRGNAGLFVLSMGLEQSPRSERTGRNLTSAENPSTLATPLRHRPRRRHRAERCCSCCRAAGAGECGGRRRPRAGADAGRDPPRARLAQPLLEYGRRRVRRDAPAALGPRALRRARLPRPHALRRLSRAERALRGADRRAEPPERALPRPPRRHRILDDPPGDAAPLARTWLRVFAPPAGQPGRGRV